MHLLILPGFSPRNKEWAESVAHHFSPQFEASVHSWKHWTSGNMADFSPESELMTIHAQLKQNEISHVIAKSIGTYVLAYGIPTLQQYLKKIILCGIPIKDISLEERGAYKNYQSVTSSDIICFQNDNDPHGSIDNIQELFRTENLDIEVKSFDGDNHQYPYFQEMSEFLLSKT